MPEAYVPSGRHTDEAHWFFDQLRRAELPEAIRGQVGNVLEIFLEDEDDTVPPDLVSFRVFLHFFERRPDVPLPSIGVNQEGRFVAVWQNPGYRLSYEFLPIGKVAWASTEKHAEKIVVLDGIADLDHVPEGFMCLRGTPTPPDHL